MAVRMRAMEDASVSGPCRKRQLRPMISSRVYPVMLQKASFTYMSGQSGRLGSAIVMPCAGTVIPDGMPLVSRIKHVLHACILQQNLMFLCTTCTAVEEGNRHAE